MFMATVTKQWTLAEVHSLPDDGNKYELVRGELFVTPAPTPTHETVIARLTRVLDPYVERQGLGLVYHAHAIMRFDGSEVEPDLFVSQLGARAQVSWDDAPVPILVVETFSPSTRRRDQVQKRSLFMDAGVAEYWMIDPERRVITAVRKGREDVVSTESMTWSHDGATEPLTFELSRVFGSIVHESLPTDCNG